MGDPVSISASIIAVLQLTGTVIQYLNNVKGAWKDRQRILNEASSVSGLLYNLQEHAEQAQQTDSWSLTLESLSLHDGPLEQFKMALERLASKLTPVEGWKKAGKQLSWPFQKEEIRDILATMERQKSFFNLALQNDHIALSQAIKTDVVRLYDEVSEVGRVIAHQERRLQDQESQALLRWLSPLDFPLQQSDLIGRKQAGTGQWLIESLQFKSWLGGVEKTLFCLGMPGAGKTMLTSILIDHLMNTIHDQDIGIAYIFCNYRDQLDQTHTNLLASLLKQLLQGRPSVSADLYKLYERHNSKGTRPTLEEVYAALQDVISQYSRVYMLVDALDECSDDDGTRRLLISRLRQLQGICNISLMVSSRPIPKIEQEFRTSLQLEVRASDEDVTKYLRGQLFRLAGCVTRNPSLQEDIIREIINTVDGMFLLAQLHLDSLTDKINPKSIKAALKRLPKGSGALDTAYNQVMERISNQKPGFKELAEQVLSWITYAHRPLTVLELTHALAIEPGESELDGDNLSDPEDLVSVCAGLVTVDQESDIVRLVHYTAQEYFERISLERFPNAPQQIATACLTYLLFDDFKEGYCSSDTALDARLRQHPFLEYAARHWGDHARETEHAIEPLALEFLTNSPKTSCSAQIMLGFLGSGYNQHSAKNISGLHLCAYFDLVHTATALLAIKTAADSRDTKGQTPLIWAAQRGSTAMFKLLLDRDDVDTDSKDNGGMTPLMWAARFGLETVARLLMRRNDVDINSEDKNGMTPLLWAARRGQEVVVDDLLERNDITADAKDINGRTALSVAAEEGDKFIVKSLLDRDDVAAGARDDLGRIPLSWAAERGHTETVELLIDRDKATLNSKDMRGKTPLSLAAGKGRTKVVELLLARKGVMADCRDNLGKTPLSLAAAQGHVEIVELLLKRNDVNAGSRDRIGQIPISWAAQKGRTKVVQLLVERNLDTANSRDKFDRTPLFLAAVAGHEEIVQILAEHDKTLTARNIFGQTALSIAIELGHMTIVQILLDHCEKYGITFPDRHMAAAKLPMNEAIELLKDQGRVWCDHCEAEISNSSPHYHCTICSNGDFDLCQPCIDKGASCLVPGHQLVKRGIKDGNIVDITDERSEDPNSMNSVDAPS